MPSANNTPALTPAYMSAVIAMIVIAIIASVFIWPAECLVVECRGDALFAWPIRAGERFEMSYTHSLNQSPVTDVIEWTGRDLSVVKSIFKTFGAGIPAPADGAGGELLYAGDHYELVGINKRMAGFSIVAHQAQNHKITLGGREAYLPDIAETGAPLYITVKRLPYFMRLASPG